MEFSICELGSTNDCDFLVWDSSVVFIYYFVRGSKLEILGSDFYPDQWVNHNLCSVTQYCH